MRRKGKPAPARKAGAGGKPKSEEAKTRRWQRWMDLGAATGCHQDPARSLFLRGKYQLPVCARCTGAFLGGLCALLWALLTRRPRVWYAALMAPGALDGITQATGYRESTNFLRVLTGWFLGFGYISALLAVATGAARVFRGFQR